MSMKFGTKGTGAKQSRAASEVFVGVLIGNESLFFRCGADALVQVKDIDIPTGALVVSFSDQDLVLTGTRRAAEKSRAAQGPVYTSSTVIGPNVFARAVEDLRMSPWRICSGPAVIAEFARSKAADLAGLPADGLYAIELPCDRGALGYNRGHQRLVLSAIVTPSGRLLSISADWELDLTEAARDRSASIGPIEVTRDVLVATANIAEFLECLSRVAEYPRETFAIGLPVRMWFNALVGVFGIVGVGLALLGVWQRWSAEQLEVEVVAARRDAERLRKENSDFVMRNLTAFARAKRVDHRQVFEIVEEAWVPGSTTFATLDGVRLAVSVVIERVDRRRPQDNPVFLDSGVRQSVLAGRRVRDVLPRVIVGNNGERIESQYAFDAPRASATTSPLLESKP